MNAALPGAINAGSWFTPTPVPTVVAGQTTVAVSPVQQTVAPGGTATFVAAVQNNVNTNVTWAVDGIAGGNATVGTISAGGVYTAPATAGTHTITATSVGAPTVATAVTVKVVSVAPNIYTGLQMADTANGHVYNLQITNGAVALTLVS
ncbi:MAG: hypothetical protein ACLQLH_03480 [Terracidiphilus sp.]